MNVKRFFNQKAVYWGTATPDGFGGSTFPMPVEIDVRWEDRVEQFIDVHGEQKLSQAIIYSDVEFTLGCYLLKGTLINVTDPGYNPQKEANAFRISRVAKSPSVRGDKFLTKAWL